MPVLSRLYAGAKQVSHASTPLPAKHAPFSCRGRACIVATSFQPGNRKSRANIAAGLDCPSFSVGSELFEARSSRPSSAAGEKQVTQLAGISRRREVPKRSFPEKKRNNHASSENTPYIS
eukprot:1156170-Pelagomonas_calceolata.AAC.3